MGGGHTHVQVLRRLAMEPLAGWRVTVVVDTPTAVYSGMVPGLVAGQYTAGELEIDVRPLVRRAGAGLVVARAVGLDAAAHRLLLDGRPPLAWDRIAFDIGSTVAGGELPGVRRHAFPTRPIGRFVAQLDELVERARRRSTDRPLRLVVVGGGAGGVELAFCFERRLRSAGLSAAVTLAESGERLLAGYPRGLARRIERRAAERGIELAYGLEVAAVGERSVTLAGGGTLASDLTVWVAGAASQSLFRDSGLPTDERGFVLVRSTLQVEGHDEIFAVGDCATLSEHPATPKAGVYAVRQGPYLDANLRAAAAGRPLASYRPQSDFLTLLNLGDGRAVGVKWGVSFEGRWVMRLKDAIDRRFMRRFQVLADDGAPTAEFAEVPPMAGQSTLCGGCAAKLGQSRLESALARLDPPPPDDTVELGLPAADDAAAWRVGGGRRAVASLDAFRAFTDDPYLVGRVGAVNALSDLWATGASPRWALALVALPETAPGEADEELLYQVLAGARAVLDAAGVTLAGGHTTTAAELMVGFSVEGLAEAGQPLLRIDGLRPGQRLILTKPLGTGVLFHADMQGLARGVWIEAALGSMLRPNAAAAGVAAHHGATGATDVTGFGLAGHLAAMARASGVSVTLALAELPVLPGALELLARGERSTFHAENARRRAGLELPPAAAGDPRCELLFDPQTSGGLLFGVAAEHAGAALAELRQRGDRAAAVVGQVDEPGTGAAVRVRPRW